MRRREWGAVIGANRLGQAMVLERPLEDPKCIALLRRRQRLARNQVAGGEIGDRQRVTVAMILEQELAFVIRAPEAIGAQRLR
jgi:hypothetical protein